MGTADSKPVAQRPITVDKYLHTALKENTSSAVIELIQNHADDISIHGLNYRLPIHIAILYEHGLDVIKVLAEAYPESLSIADAYGNLPLHTACESSSSLDIIEHLIELYPEALLSPRKSSSGDLLLPIHLACSAIKKPSEENIIYLATRCPSSLEITNDNKQTAIHYLAHYQNMPNALSILMDLYPYGMTHKDSKGKTPLHFACCSDYPNDDAIMLLIKQYPMSVSICDKFGFLPIHRACKYKTSSKVIEALILAYPNSLLIPYHEESLPIHIACANIGLNDDAIISLISHCPQSLQKQNKYGYLPLHNASIFKSSSIINHMCEKYPGSLLIKDSYGYLPIHKAANRYNSSAVLSLANNNRTTLSVPTNSGALPIHLACRSNKGVEIVHMLIELYPESLGYSDVEGNLPLHNAVKSNMPSSVIIKMIQLYPSSLSPRPNKRGTPIEMIICGYSKIHLIDVVRYVVRHPPETLYRNSYDYVNTLDLVKSEPVYRLMLNASYEIILNHPIHYSNYRRLNWKAREPLLILAARCSVEERWMINSQQKALYRILKEFGTECLTKFIEQSPYLRIILGFV